MTLKAFAEYKSEHQKKLEAERLSQIAARLIGEVPPEDEGTAGGGSSAPTARYASLIRKCFEYTGRYEPSGGGVNIFYVPDAIYALK